jgi:type III pantothenate kinase
MNIAVDYGNTIAKVGIFKDDLLLHKHSFPDKAALQSFVEHQPAEKIIVISVSFPSEDVLSWSPSTGLKIALSPDLPLPIKILYKTPKTLGVDRLAAVCGALHIFPGQNCLVIDAGTCITYEFLDDQQNYHGGAISPGVNMRFASMHTLTAKLPLAKAVPHPPLIGNSTETCLQSGVINGVTAEIEGIIQKYLRQFPDTQILLCGGDAPLFEILLNQSIFAAPDLILVGLNRILKHIIRL